MANEHKTKLTVVSNKEHINKTAPITNPLRKDVNPYLQKLLQFTNCGKQKKISVEDLLKW